VAVSLLGGRDASTTRTAPPPGMEVPAQDGRRSEVLKAGNVILLAGRGRVAEARALARKLAGGEATPALTRAGQAVIVQEGPGRGGIVAVAYRHQFRAETAADPALTAFVEYWLARGT
jgi:hypothetical protein